MSAWKDYKHVTINSKVYKLAELKSSQFNGEYDEEVASFIEEWCSDDEYLDFQTSGSTGAPKLIGFHKDECVASARQTINHFALKSGESALLCLPVKYVASKMMIVRAIVGSLNLILEPPSSKPNIRAEGLNFAAMTPMQVSNLMENDVATLDRIDKLIIGGGRISETLKARLAYRKSKIYETYGMTETLTHVAIRPLAPKQEQHFRALKGVHFAQGRSGELIVRVPYLASSPIITRDLVELVNESEMKWLGRLDDIVNSGGIKLHLIDIEKEIERYCSFAFICVGLEDDVLGEKLVLIVERDDHVLNQLEQIKSVIEEKLPKVKRPKQIVIVDELMRTESGKVSRKLNKSLILGCQNR